MGPVALLEFKPLIQHPQLTYHIQHRAKAESSQPLTRRPERTLIESYFLLRLGRSCVILQKRIHKLHVAQHKLHSRVVIIASVSRVQDHDLPAAHSLLPAQRTTGFTQHSVRLWIFDDELRLYKIFGSFTNHS